jgi:hypothetical protein
MWLAGGFVLALLIPFVFADRLEINRDVYYAIYGAAVISFVAAWARLTGIPLARLALRRPWLTIALALASSAILVLIVYRTDEATPHPEGLEFAAAIAWRGVFYGAVDGLLLSVFPIIAVFAAFEGTSPKPWRNRRRCVDCPGGVARHNRGVPRGVQRLSRREDP